MGCWKWKPSASAALASADPGRTCTARSSSAARFRGLAAPRQDGGQLEIGVVVVWVGGQFLAKRLHRAIGVAGKQERLPQVRLQRGKTGLSVAARFSSLTAPG